MEKAFAYLRVSGKGQVDGDGFTRQELAIKEYAKAHNLKIVQTFKEEGISGTSDLENRPALQQLMQALHSNGTKTVLVEKLDRLARDLMIQESILHDLQKNGFKLISVAEPDLCSDDPSRKLMRQIMGAFAEYEKTMIVLKLRGARVRQRAKLGKCEGRKPYGEHQGEREVLDRILRLSLERLSANRIASMLNQEGVRTRSGGEWYSSNILKIVRNQKNR